MRRRYISYLRLIGRAFRPLPASTRAHAAIRFITAPFLPVVDALPASGHLLDIGGGHGIFALLAVEAARGTAVVVDPDLRKILRTYAHPAVRFVGGLDAAIRGSFDAVSMIDVLYRIPLVERDEMFERIFARLRPGGVFVMKEMDPRRKLKAWWNGLQERLNSRFLGITLGDEIVYETPEDIARRLSRAGFVSIESRRIDAWYPHPHLLYVARRPPANANESVRLTNAREPAANTPRLTASPL